VEQPKIAKQFYDAVNQSSGFRKRSPLFYVLLIVAITLLGTDTYVRYQAVPGLRKRNADLLEKVRRLERRLDQLQAGIEQKDNDIFRLKTLLAPFEKAAMKRYPGAVEEALDRLSDELDHNRGELADLHHSRETQQKEINKLKRQRLKDQKQIAELKGQLVKLEEQYAEQQRRLSDLSDLNAYLSVATWDQDGDAILWKGQRVETPVSGWMKGFRKQDDTEKMAWQCGSSALFHYREVMDAHPAYPFPYYVVAKCLEARGESSWKDYAKKGVSILEKTTRISGHAPDHDDALADLSALLKKGE